MAIWSMKGAWWVIGLIAVSGLAGCGHKTVANAPEGSGSVASSIAGSSLHNTGHSNAGHSNAGQSVDVAKSPSDQSLNSQSSQTSAASGKSNQSLPVPNLIPPTTAAVRVPQSEAGRPDPFATILVAPTVSVRPSANASTNANTAPAVPSAASVPVATLPSLPVGQTVPMTQSPPVGVSNLPPARRLSETIEISGVVEVGGKTSVIVKAPDEHSSRYVQVGDYVSNGKVLVKRVEMGMEPVVILEEDGAEVTRYVGGGSSLAGLL